VAAERMGIREFTGIELDDYYLSVARERLAAPLEPAQPDLF
jgi:hypothetical protein